METKITRVAEQIGLGDSGQSIPVVRVEFTIGAHGPFSVIVPKNKFTQIEANRQVAEYAAHIKGLQGLV
jgi:hypothetical protein